MWSVLMMMVLAFVQSVSFSMVSRSRNRNHNGYHVICALASNGVWYLTAKYLVVNQGMPWLLFIPYTIATVGGSVYGSNISAWIEKKIGATS